jgi:hypothetical protein
MLPELELIPNNIYLIFLVANSEEANYSNNFMKEFLLLVVGTIPQ